VFNWALTYQERKAQNLPFVKQITLKSTVASDVYGEDFVHHGRRAKKY
jgi:hypothetical protein